MISESRLSDDQEVKITRFVRMSRSQVSAIQDVDKSRKQYVRTLRCQHCKTSGSHILGFKEFGIKDLRSLLRRLPAQTLPNAIPPTRKIHPFCKIAVTVEPVMRF